MITTEQIKKLSTKRLLTYYRKHRFKLHSCTCECCGEFMWNIYPENYVKEKIHFEEWEKHLSIVKEELNKREHVERNK